MNNIILSIMILCSLLLSGTVQNIDETKESVLVIPDEAIRLRILANSDHGNDQRIKYLVRDKVTEFITELVEPIDSINEARVTMEKALPEIEQIIGRTLREENRTDTFSVKYDKDVSFPLKVYDRFVYPPGEYEAILITLGEGRGANWWCVLFPPLCFIDFSNGTTIAQTEDEQEIKSEGEAPPNEEIEEEDSAEVKFFLLEWLGIS